MRQTWESIFDTSRYSRVIDKDRARLVYGIAVLMVSLLTVFTFVQYGDNGITANVWQRIPNEPVILFLLVFLLFTCVGSVVLTRTGRLTLGSLVLVLSWSICVGVPIAQRGLYNYTGGIFLLTSVLLASLLLDQRGLIIGTIITAALFVYGVASRVNYPAPTSWDYGIGDMLSGVFLLFLISGILYLFLRFAKITQQEALTGVREDRLLLAEITTQVAQRISRRMALDDVLASAVEQVRDSYPDIYHAQIFLVDDNRKNARLVASTGEVGRKLMERHHEIGIGSQSVIGQVTAWGKPVVARADSTETVHRRNELLPETRVEVAFPLRIGDLVIGALDLQSKTISAFQEADLPIFQSLSDHIAIAIDNARLFDETEKRIHENQKLVDQTQGAMKEVERLNQRLTGRFWDNFLSEQDDRATGVNVQFNDLDAQPDPQWTPGLQQAIQSNHSIQQQADGKQIIALPLRVRGQVIGAMEFELDSAGNLSSEEMNMLEEVGEQLGLAAETSRLFQGSQRLAQREALVNEIATRLQTSNNVETALTEAARSLRDALRAHKVAIRLGTPPANVANGDRT